MMSNKTYDVLKWVALVVLPAAATFYLGLGNYWDIPYPEAIAGTITLIDAFLGTVLGISSVQYSKKGEKK